MPLEPPYTLSSPTSGQYLDNPSHSLQHRETKRAIDDLVSTTAPEASDAVIAQEVFH